MENEATCLCDVCQDCLNAESDGLWICYYNQYRVAINGLLATDCAKESILPLLNMVSTYIELWVKAICFNFGMGSDYAIHAERFTGHNLTGLLEKLRNSIRMEEYIKIKEDLLIVWDIVDGLTTLSAAEDISLTEATRYPQTRSKSCAIDQCLFAHLVEMCTKFQIDDLIDDIRILMNLTYDIYDQIYEIRVLHKSAY